MSVKTVAVSAVLMAGLLVPASALAGPATTAKKKKPTVAAQLKTLKTQVKKNTATGKSNTKKIKAASKAVATTFAGVNKSINAANDRTTQVDGKVNSLDGRLTGLDSKVNVVITTATDALTQLQAGLVKVGDGLTQLAASYSDFEYGVVQLYAGTTAMPGAFLATPRLDPTVEQATVTGQFPCLAPTAGACTAGENLHLNVAVRSANPETDAATSKVYCRVTASQPAQASIAGGVTAFVTSTPNEAFGGAPAYEVPRSPLVPTSAEELAVFPLSMVSTDTQVDLASTSNSAGLSVAATTIPGQAAGGFRLQNTQGPGMISVTLSCLKVPNQA